MNTRRTKPPGARWLNALWVWTHRWSMSTDVSLVPSSLKRSYFMSLNEPFSEIWGVYVSKCVFCDPSSTLHMRTWWRKLDSVCALNWTRLDTLSGHLGRIDFTARFLLSRKSLLVNRKSVELYLFDADCFLLFSSACLRDTVHSSPNGHEDTELFIPSQFAV